AGDGGHGGIVGGSAAAGGNDLDDVAVDGEREVETGNAVRFGKDFSCRCDKGNEQTLGWGSACRGIIKDDAEGIIPVCLLCGQNSDLASVRVIEARDDLHDACITGALELLGALDIIEVG